MIQSTCRLSCTVTQTSSTSSQSHFFRMHSADAQFLYGLEGTEVTTDNKTDDDQISVEPLLQTWKTTQKLPERAFFLTQTDVDEGHGSPFTAGKYLCRRKEDPAKMAFMRIYQQIPIVSTEGAKTNVRVQQATPADPYPELETLWPGNARS